MNGFSRHYECKLQAYLTYLESKNSVQLIMFSILLFYKVLARKSEGFQSKAVKLIGLDSNSKTSPDLAILSSVQIVVLTFHSIGCCQTLSSDFLSLLSYVQVGAFSEVVSIVQCNFCISIHFFLFLTGCLDISISLAFKNIVNPRSWGMFVELLTFDQFGLLQCPIFLLVALLVEG